MGPRTGAPWGSPASPTRCCRRGSRRRGSRTGSCHWRRSARIGPGHCRDDLGHRRPVAAQQTEDAQIAASTERGCQRIVLARSLPLRSLRRRFGQVPDDRAGIGLLARRQRLPRGETCSSAISAPILAASASTAETLEVRTDVGGGRPFAAERGRRLAGLGVDRVDLEQPVPGGRLDGVARAGAGATRAEARLRVVLRAAHGPRVRGRCRDLGRGLVLVVGALRRSMRFVGGPRLRSGTDRELAALVREPSRLGTRPTRGGRPARGIRHRRLAWRRRRRRRGGGHVVGAAGRRVKERRGGLATEGCGRARRRGGAQCRQGGIGSPEIGIGRARLARPSPTPSVPSTPPAPDPT